METKGERRRGIGIINAGTFVPNASRTCTNIKRNSPSDLTKFFLHLMINGSKYDNPKVTQIELNHYWCSLSHTIEIEPKLSRKNVPTIILDTTKFPWMIMSRVKTHLETFNWNEPIRCIHQILPFPIDGTWPIWVVLYIIWRYQKISRFVVTSKDETFFRHDICMQTERMDNSLGKKHKTPILYHKSVFLIKIGGVLLLTHHVYITKKLYRKIESINWILNKSI